MALCCVFKKKNCTISVLWLSEISRAEEMAQELERLLCEFGDLSLDTQIQV